MDRRLREMGAVRLPRCHRRRRPSPVVQRVILSEIASRPRPETPTANGAYWRRRVDGRLIDEHRRIAEEVLGRRLRRHEVVHHRNGDSRDNRLENLELMSRSEHAELHARIRRGEAAYVHVPASAGGAA